MINDINTQKRKKNIKLYSIYGPISIDLFFYYAIEFLFLTQVKNIDASDVVLKSSFYALFMIILQIPANILIDKIGNRKCTILANIYNVIYLLMILFVTNLQGLIIAEFFSALCFSIKDVSDTTLLNVSIPDGNKKAEVYSKILGKSRKNYYYLNAITLVLSGFLYTINPYIPVVCSLIISLLATILSSQFQEIDDIDLIKENQNTSEKQYIKDIINSFKFIIKSQRLRSLILYSGIIWGVFCLVSTYRTSLLNDVGISATWIAIVAAMVEIASGIGSKYQLKFHNILKNKTLSTLGLTTAIMIFLSGIIGISNIIPNIIMLFVTIFYIVININKGMYQVLITRYLGNFTNPNIITKIYSVNAISRNIFRMIIGFLGSYLLKITDTANSLILIGIIFMIVTIALISYMKTRTGLKPEEYKKEEIEFDI